MMDRNNKRLAKLTKKMNFSGHTLTFGERTLIMGILNLTPDSFSDGGDYISVDKAVEHTRQMILDGADIIDIGGESSRPGHKQITSEEECKRVMPVIKRLSRETDAILSLDTIRAEVAEEAMLNGAHIINDIWGFQGDPNMADVAAKYSAPVVLMHNQDSTEYGGDIIDEIKAFFTKSVEIADKAGVAGDKIILDPGIGFGKTFEQNLEVMARLDEFSQLDYPILLGTSRKSMIGHILDVPPKDRDEGTIATTVLGITQGVDILRVHNVLGNIHAAKVADKIVRIKE